MSNATTAYQTILNAQVCVDDHSTYVAYWSNEAHITAFVATQVDADLIANAQGGDYYAMERIADDVRKYTSFEIMDDEALQARIEELSQVEDWNEVEGKYELGESDYAYHLIGVIEDLLAMRRYTAPVSPWLTHSPFAGLVSA